MITCRTSGAIVGVAVNAILAGSTFAQGVGPQINAPAQPQENVQKNTIRPMATHCFTNARDCAGVAPFDSNGNEWSCTIFWNNGANGHSNFTLRIGQNASYYVRYNDTAACVPGLNGGSEGASRYWIWVP
jgi:hypothetical protein